MNTEHELSLALYRDSRNRVPTGNPEKQAKEAIEQTRIYFDVLYGLHEAPQESKSQTS